MSSANESKSSNGLDFVVTSLTIACSLQRDLRNALGDKYKENGSLFLVLGEIDKVL